MPETKEKLTAAGLLGNIYKNVKMGADSIINLMPSVKDEQMRLEMTSELDRYEDFATRAAAMLSEIGVTPKEENFFTKTTSKIGMAMNTATDSSTAHIAEMMIQGTTMGVTDMLRELSAADECRLTGDAVSLAREVADFEENAVEKLKNFI